MESDTLTTTAILKVLFTATAGALIAFIPSLLLAGRAEKQARSRELWRRDADLCARLEELAGEITDRLSGWAVRPEQWEEIGEKIGELGQLSGKFPRYPVIQQCVRDLHNTAGRMWADRNHYDTNEERKAVTAEIRERQAALLAACGKATGRRQ
jgi:gas vesicle protein